MKIARALTAATTHPDMFVAKTACADPDTMVSVERTFYPDDPHSAKFTYRAQLIRKASGGHPTVIVHPGGPGETSIGDTSWQGTARVPDGFGVLLTDPRGVGCNLITDIARPEAFFSTDIFAHDVIAIIRQMKLQNYMIYGHSYGTVLGTHVAAKIESAGNMPKPAALILDGVIGRAFRPGETFETTLKMWEEFKRVAPEDHLAYIVSDDHPSKADGTMLSDVEWGGLVGSHLSLFFSASKFWRDGFSSTFLQLAPACDPAKRSAAHGILKSIVANLVEKHPNADLLQRWVACRETSLDIYPSFAFKNGELVGRATGLCKSMHLDRPYDAGQFKVTVPIYYFSGTSDPTTPVNHAIYHFEQHRQAPRTFITIPNGTHESFLYLLQDAMPKIFAAIEFEASTQQSGTLSPKLLKALRSAKINQEHKIHYYGATANDRKITPANYYPER